MARVLGAAIPLIGVVTFYESGRLHSFNPLNNVDIRVGGTVLKVEPYQTVVLNRDGSFRCVRFAVAKSDLKVDKCPL